nr:DUF2231 domain-containing protein [Corynebacterium lactis]
MLTRIAGLPAHPLLVHFAVVIVPVAAIAAIVYVAAPRLRDRFATVSAVLSVLALLGTAVAKSAGESMLPLMGLSERNPGQVADHAEYADMLMIAVIVMTIGMVVAWAVNSPWATTKLAILRTWRSWAAPLGMVLAVIGAVASIVLVVITGHEGASLTWSELS